MPMMCQVLHGTLVLSNFHCEFMTFSGSDSDFMSTNSWFLGLQQSKNSRRQDYTRIEQDAPRFSRDMHGPKGGP